MRAHCCLMIAILVTACGCSPGDSPAESTVQDPVAHYEGGQLSLADLEARVSSSRTQTCRTARQTRGGGSLDGLIPCYREMAERLAFERLVAAEIPDIDKAIEGLGEPYQALRQRAYINSFNRRLTRETKVSDEEIAAHFETHRERYRRPRTLTLWNLFRRHGNPAQPKQTHAFLRSLKKRYLAGETFAALAREHSQSETRLRDGLVGTIQEGRLPARLEKIAFALAEGEVSEPVPVAGGAVLLHVRQSVEGGSPNLDELRVRIQQEILTLKVQDQIKQRIADRQPPADAIVLAPEKLIVALDDEDEDQIVLAIANTKITAKEFRKRLQLAPSSRADGLDEDAHQALLDNYQALLTPHLLFLELLDSADATLREEAEDQLRTDGTLRLVDEQIRTEMGQLVDSDPALLKLYYDDNRPHYQSPLRFKLHILDLPFGDNPPAQLKQLEQLRQSLVKGELDPAAAAARMGGEFRDLDWVPFDSLADVVPDKALKYLLQVDKQAADVKTSGFSVPYQQDEALHLLWLEERQEPQPQAYDVVQAKVREDYLLRFQQELSAQVIKSRLEAAEFVFDEEAVRRLLVPGEETTSTDAAAKGPD